MHLLSFFLLHEKQALQGLMILSVNCMISVSTDGISSFMALNTVSINWDVFPLGRGLEFNANTFN